MEKSLRETLTDFDRGVIIWTVLGTLSIFVAWTLLVGCAAEEMPEAPAQTAVPVKMEKDAGRFKVTFGQFFAGYDRNRREILIVEDVKTGRRYLTITGCGTTELLETGGKNSETVEE